MNWRKSLAIALIAAVTLGTLLLVMVVVLALQSRPLVVEVDQLTPERARQARDLASRMVVEFVNAEHPQDIVVGRDELNGLMALVGRAQPRVQGRVNVDRSGVIAAVSVTVPRNPVGRYLNLSVLVGPSGTGLDLQQVRIGSIRLPRAMSMPLARLTLNLILGDDNGSVMLGMVRSLAIIEDGRVAVSFHRIPDFQARLARIRSRLRLVRDEVAVLGNPALVRAYYQDIIDMADLIDPQSQMSLAAYMSPLFRAAQERSRTSSAVEENRAAILALAIYFGNARFENLTGPVRTQAMKRHQSRAEHVTLAGRQDSRLHFVYSAALKLASDTRASFAIGEFKELLDTAPKGSGFSFADLAADRAGVWFAESATRSEDSARRLQALLARDRSEGTFFPVIADLPENLLQQTYEREYVDLDSAQYRAVIAEIDGRLRQLPLHRVDAEVLPAQ